MSYLIFYKSMFVNTERGIIPMASMGSNNSYEALNPRKRTRDWSNMNLDDTDKKLYSHNQIVCVLDGWNEEYKQKYQADLESNDPYRMTRNSSFGDCQGMAVTGKHPCITTYNDVRNLIMSGEDLALSLEEAIKNCGLHFSYNENKEFELSSWKRIRPRTVEDFWSTFDKLEESGTNFWLHYDNYSANRTYDFQKALKSLISRKGKSKYFSNKKYIMITQPNTDNSRYVSIKDGKVVLTDRIEESFIFNKQCAGDKDAVEIIYHFLPEVTTIRFDYNIAV